MRATRAGSVMLALALGLVPGPGCEYRASTPETCGNGVIDPGEACDLEDLGGRTCGDLLAGTEGRILCNSDCTVFTGLCVLGSCGDGVLDPAEDCDDGNASAGDGCSATCAWELPSVCGDYNLDPGEACDDGNLRNGDGCSSTCQLEEHGPCGDGIIHWGEACDGLELDGLTCEVLGHTGGELGCDPDCRLDESACLDCAGNEVICGTVCADVFTDASHCGECDQPCDPGTPCVGGTCLAADATWHLVLPGPGDASEVVTAHDLVAIDAGFVLAWIAAGDPGKRVKTKVFEPGLGTPGLGTWLEALPWPSGSATEIADAVALGVGDGLAYRVWSRGDGSGAENVHAERWNGATWDEREPPGWRSACGRVTFLDIALSWWSSGWELLAMGQPFCGGAVQHAFGVFEWETHPAPTGVPGQVIAHAAGRPAVTVTMESYVALAELDQGLTRHTVRFWNGEWIQLGSALDQNDSTGLQEDMALTSGSGDTLWVAWSESDGADPPVHDVFVKQLDPPLEDWIPVGAGPVNPTPGAITPSILVIGPSAWVAYVDVSGGPGQVRVRRFDPLSGTWVDAGGALNLDPALPAESPVLAGSLGRPYVAFREGDALHVKYLF